MTERRYLNESISAEAIIELYVVHDDGSPVGDRIAEKLIEPSEQRDLEDLLANTANDWLEDWHKQHDGPIGLAARVHRFDGSRLPPLETKLRYKT